MRMKEKLKNIRFDILLISIGMIVFSLSCWVSLAGGIVDYLARHYPVKNKAVESEKIMIEEEISSNIITSSDQNVVQSIFDKVDKVWYRYMYQKAYLSKMDSYATYMVTGEIISSQVLLGSDNWLFYKSVTDGTDSIADYEGTNLYTNSEMESILKSVLNVQNEFVDMGIEFAILVPPNKENIYSEFMPDTYKHAEVSSTDLLVEHLANGGVNIVSAKEDLLFYHSDFQLYYTYDTHWNQLGAYIGVKNVLDLWGIEIPSLDQRIILEKNLKGNYHYGGSADLAGMVGLRSIFDDEIEYEIEDTLTVDWTQFQIAQNNKQMLYYENPNAQKNETILLIGDSFRASMVPALREIYKNLYVVYNSDFKSEMLDWADPDYVIVEYVERSSRNMQYDIGNMIQR